MKISKDAIKLAKDLGLSEIDAYIMEIKSKLYIRCARLIKNTEFTHEEIAKMVGTSRARISRISKMGEASVSLEILIKVSAVLEKRGPIKIVA